MLGEVAADGGRAAGRVRHDPRRGPTRSARASSRVRANADNGPDAANARAVRRRGHRPVPHRAHVPRRGPAAGRAAHDPRRHARGGGGRARASCASVQKADFVEILEAMDGLPVTVRLLDPPLHEFLPARRRARASRRPPAACSTRRSKLLAAARDVAGVQPDARHARRAPRRREAGPLRDAGAGADGGRRPSAPTRAASPIVEIMIPLTVTREELDAGPHGGSRRRSRPRPRRVARRSPKVTHRHDDRDAPRRACAATRSPRRPTSSRSAPTTSRR